MDIAPSLILHILYQFLTSALFLWDVRRWDSRLLMAVLLIIFQERVGAVPFIVTVASYFLAIPFSQLKTQIFLIRE